jgi:serine/threonine-protein kinase
MVKYGDGNKAGVIDEILTQFVSAYIEGEQPDIERFVEQYPDYEAQVRQRVEGLCEIDSLFRSLVQADDTEFDGPAALHDLTGQKVASFEVQKVIGRGGMGVVYLARDAKLGRQVAIKSVPAELLRSSTARTRLKHEAKLLASLNHPNIGVIYDIIEQEDGIAFLILEYVPGETLGERIAGKPLALDEALAIAQHTAEALSAAHQQGVIHRDIKPGNIKITPANMVKVLDFGLAKTTDSQISGTETTATQPNRIMGTPAYMSPEQVRGSSTDHRTDIWSFGCILYEMLTGQRPFEGDTVSDSIARTLEREPDWGLLPQKTPVTIRNLLRRCLEKDPQQRLPHMKDAVLEIKKASDSIAITPRVTVSPRLRTMIAVAGTVAAIILLAICARLIFPSGPLSTLQGPRLVVLPLENLGSTEDEPFADDITNEMRTCLASIPRLRVTSRYSAMQYRNRERSVRQIAEDLRVAYILDGTILFERPSDPNGPLRISVQLIKAADDTQVWAQAYDSDMRKVLYLPSEVAERVAQALGIKLLEPERNALARQPTENTEARYLYQRGNDYSSRGYQSKSDLDIAIDKYKQAVELDDSFALARAKLSQAYSGRYWFHGHNEEDLTMAFEEAKKALKLDPNLAEAHWALGYYYYWGYRDCDQALPHFEIARSSQPNNSRFISAISYAQKWQGKFDQALANIEKAYDLDPLSHTLAAEAGLVCLLMRKYPQAEYYLNRSIRLAPDFPRAYEWKAKLYLRSKGDIEKARDVVDEALRYVKTEDQERLSYLLVDLDVYEGKYQDALDRLDSMLEDANSVDTRHAMLYARIYDYWGNKTRATKYYDDARRALEKLENRLQETPEKAWVYRSLGIAYAGLGLKEEAIQEGRRATELVPVSENPWLGTFPIEDLARIYTMVGEHDAAIDRIEFLLDVHGRMSIPMLRLDPAWKPLRDHPRLKKRIEAGK